MYACVDAFIGQVILGKRTVFIMVLWFICHPLTSELENMLEYISVLKIIFWGRLGGSDH